MTLPLPPKKDPPSEPYWLLRRTDQTVVAALALVAIAALVLYMGQRWWHGRGVIDIDHATPHPVTFQVDVNVADWPEISQIPDLGETLSRRIVEARTTDGPFRNLGDLRQRIKGLGPKTMEKITPFLAPIRPASAVSQTDPADASR